LAGIKIFHIALELVFSVLEQGMWHLLWFSLHQ